MNAHRILFVFLLVAVFLTPAWAQNTLEPILDGAVTAPEAPNQPPQKEELGRPQTIFIAGPAGPAGLSGARGLQGEQGPQGPKGEKGRHGYAAWIDENGNVWKVVPKDGEYTGKNGNKMLLIGKIPSMAKTGWAWCDEQGKGKIFWVSRKMIPRKLVDFQGADSLFYYRIGELPNIPEPAPPPRLSTVFWWYLLGIAVIGLIIALIIWLINRFFRRQGQILGGINATPAPAGRALGPI